MTGTGPCLPEFTTTDAAFDYLASFANFERQTPMREAYRLDRMAALLADFGNPQLAVPAIHIAGSKGKGSTAQACAAILARAGLRVGLYASPHLLDWRERICHPDGFFPDAAYLEAISAVRSHVRGLAGRTDWGHGEPTTFELLTLAAYLLFRDAGLDWMVIETGLGGLLDATNLMRPQACLITSLELEHTDILGTTIEEIAAQKAGIFKPGALLLAQYPLHDAERICPVLEAAAARAGGLLEWVEEGTGSCGIPCQDTNQALAVRALSRLRETGRLGAVDSEGWDRTVGLALDGCSLPGRLQWFGRAGRREILLDVAHTPDSVRRALTAFQPRPGDGLLFGSVSGKRHEAMAGLLAGAFSEIIITTPGTFKKSDPQAVWSAFHAINDRSRLIESPGTALWTLIGALSAETRALVCGSFYLAAAIHGGLREAGFSPVRT